MKKILITGAGGYIGSVAASIFLDKGYEVVAVDNFSKGYRQPLEYLIKKHGEGKIRFYAKDLTTDLSPLFKVERDIDVVVHYGAFCSVDESMASPDRYFINNVYGTANLLKAMDDAGVRRIIFSSTCAVYGEAQYMPVDEEHPVNPANPYGASKKISEEMIDWYFKVKDFSYIILRYFNVCGATEDGAIGDSKKPSSLLVQNAVRGALGIESFFLTCPEVDTPDKTPIRDYINVLDLNEAHVAAVEYVCKGKTDEIINLGTGTGHSVLEVIRSVQDATGKTFELAKTTPRKGEYAKMIAKTDKAKRVLGWESKRTISDSVKSLVRWYQSHPNGWDD